MNRKKLIPCIYLYKKKAVLSFGGKETIVDDDPLRLAAHYEKSGADGLIIFDLSEGDAAHEEALDAVKAICDAVAIPVTGAGNVRRMEDIKKLLYAGCKKAALNYALPSNIELTAEVSLKFGSGKIAACVDNARTITEQKALLEQYVSEMILVTEQGWECCCGLCSVPLTVMLSEAAPETVADALGRGLVCGITGGALNANAQRISELRSFCAERGICMHKAGQLETDVKWEDFKLNSDGMVPVIVQDYRTDAVLMAAYMNREAYEATIETGKMTYFSRSRQTLWLKGETSGHFQYVKSLTADCDMDTILAKVRQVGNACHTGSYSCFFHEIAGSREEKENPLKVLQSVLEVIEDRKAHPREGSYTNYLFDKGIDKILKKLGEEATEIVIAAKNPNPNEIKYEISDFLYHMMVLMAEKGVTWDEITEDLAKR